MESSYTAFGQRRQPCLCGPALWLAPLGLVAVISAGMVHLHSRPVGDGALSSAARLDRATMALSKLSGEELGTILGRPVGDGGALSSAPPALTATMANPGHMPMDNQHGQDSTTGCYVPAGPMPHKHALSYVTPRALQMERGGRSMLKVPELGACASPGRTLAALGSSALPGRGRPSGRPATASAADRARRLSMLTRAPNPQAAAGCSRRPPCSNTRTGGRYIANGWLALPLP